jgi:hypothetical protein
MPAETQQIVYMDNPATTRVDPRVVEAFMEVVDVALEDVRQRPPTRPSKLAPDDVARRTA